MSDRRLKQRLALFARLPTMAEEMEDVEVQDPPTKTALTLWMAGSTAEVGQWIQEGSLPLTEWAAPEKGSYVGFRDTADRAAERHKQRCIKEGKTFDKNDMRLLEIWLDVEAYVKMSTDKIKEPGPGWVMRLHYESFPRSGFDWGVWYYVGKPFDLYANGVSVIVKYPF